LLFASPFLLLLLILLSLPLSPQWPLLSLSLSWDGLNRGTRSLASLFSAHLFPSAPPSLSCDDGGDEDYEGSPEMRRRRGEKKRVKMKF